MKTKTPSDISADTDIAIETCGSLLACSLAWIVGFSLFGYQVNKHCDKISAMTLVHVRYVYPSAAVLPKREIQRFFRSFTADELDFLFFFFLIDINILLYQLSILTSLGLTDIHLSLRA